MGAFKKNAFGVYEYWLHFFIMHIYMKKRLLIIPCLLSFSIAFSQKTVQAALEEIPATHTGTAARVMILGSLHFNFSENGSDIKGANNFDILSAQKQQELTLLIAKIRQFKPTKIAVEMMFTDQKRLDSLFELYKNNSWKLGKNETYQIGFRLAKEMGLKGVHCVDTRPYQVELDTTIADFEDYAKQRNELALMQHYDKPNQQFNAYMERLKNEMPLTDYLLFMNSEPVKRRYKQFFLTGLVNLGAGDTYIGADLTGYWYRRNTRIFTNVSRIMEKEDERILVIYGNSHAWILEELFAASPEFQVVKTESVLR
jgi:hypothetical protein